MTSEHRVDARPTVSVVVPCYRSGATLPALVDRLIPALDQCSAKSEVVLVVDGSPDDTWRVARAAEHAAPAGGGHPSLAQLRAAQRSTGRYPRGSTATSW